MIFIAAWFIDISIYGCINVSTQNAGSDFLFVEFSSSYSISFPLRILLQHFCCCIFLFSAATKILKDCRGSKSKCKTENKTRIAKTARRKHKCSLEGEVEHKSKLAACSIELANLPHQLRPLVLKRGEPAAAARRVVPPAAATRWVRHIKGNGAKIWHAVSSCLEYRSEHWPQMQLQLPSPSLFGIIAQPPLQQLFCALVSTFFFFRLPAKILVRKVSGIRKNWMRRLCVCFFGISRNRLKFRYAAAYAAYARYLGNSFLFCGSPPLATYPARRCMWLAAANIDL